MRSSVLCLLAVLLGSCAPGDEPIEYATIKFERTSGECADGPCARISLSYPEITDAATRDAQSRLNQEILRVILKSIDIEGSRESPEALAEELFFYYDRTLKEFPDYAAQWYIERSAEILLDSLGMVTVEFVDHIYTGGAHPLRQQLYRMFDTRTGEPLRVDSLVAEGAGLRLESLAERGFRRVRAIPAGTGLNEAGFRFQGNRFALNENIGLTRCGLEIIFNPYEVAPYAMGSTVLVLPYDSLQGVLDFRRRLR